MDNYTVARDYIKNPNGYFKNNKNVSYHNGVFYSYDTAIGKIVKDIANRDALIVSSNNFSKTTTHHIHLLEIAAHQAGIESYSVPQFYEDWDFSPTRTLNKAIESLETFAKENLKRQKNRYGVIQYYNMLARMTYLNMYQDFNRCINDVLHKNEEVYWQCVNYGIKKDF